VDRKSVKDLIRADSVREKRLEYLGALRRTGSARSAMAALGVGKSTYYRVIADTNTDAVKGNRHISVLVVADKYYTRLEIQDSLLEAGIVADLAASGQEALELVRQNSYTCVLTDQVMVGIDGLQLAEKVMEIDSEGQCECETNRRCRARIAEQAVRGRQDPQSPECHDRIHAGFLGEMDMQR
jgi:CheY-like chemotaxis protein